MERLTERGFDFTSNFVKRDIDSWSIAQALKKLQNYEDAEEQGLLLRLPCKVGDTVWGLIRFSGGGRVPSWYELCRYTFTLSMFQEIGKTVFLTREEAESALAEKGGAE